MIPPAVVEEIKRLLTVPGLSQRKIALLTCVSRASVGAIAAGRRPDYPPRCNPDEDPDDLPQGPAERCRCCGGMVYMPCRLCCVRMLKAKDRERSRDRSRDASKWQTSPRDANAREVTSGEPAPGEPARWGIARQVG
jgi:hypothetical protein